MNMSFSRESKKPLSWLDKEFTMIRRIGRGYFGKVVQARNNTDGFEYAIKISNAKIRISAEKENYLAEMRHLS